LSDRGDAGGQTDHEQSLNISAKNRRYDNYRHPKSYFNDYRPFPGYSRLFLQETETINNQQKTYQR
jgi:hypothetical protein